MTSIVDRPAFLGTLAGGLLARRAARGRGAAGGRDTQSGFLLADYGVR
jgi:hypothetical protein